MAAPVNVPIEFDITPSTVMNAFYVPALAGMIYAMPAMETKLHAVINQPGEYEGFSANYSGAGFSHMRFKFHGLDGAAFDQWVAQVRAAPAQLGRAEYLALEKPSEREPVRHYGQAMAGLFDAVVNLCVEPTQMCMKDMMAIDAQGGLGLANVYNVARLSYDDVRRRGHSLLPPDEYVTALCAVEPEQMLSASNAPLYGPRRLAP
jgi:cytochrome o ubiquinol oxidase subunit 2